MEALRVGGCVLGGVFLVSSAMGGGACDPAWVCFEEESSARILADAELVLNDASQKSYAWGDVNNNGMVDLVVARKQPWTTAGKRTNVLLMNEGGVLVDRTEDYAGLSDFEGDQGFLTATNDRDVVLVDVNNDGWLDIVTATYSLAPEMDEPKHVSHPRVYMNLGNDVDGNWLGFRHEDGRFPQMHPFADPRFYSVTAADVNGDGYADLFFTDGSFGNPPSSVDFNDRLFLNDGNGFFVDATAGVLPEAFTVSSESVRGGAADFDGDGRLDLFKINAAVPPLGIRIAYNTDSEPFAFDADIQVPVAITAGTSVLAADLTGNGLPDLIETGEGLDRYHLNVGPDPETGRAVFETRTFESSAGSVVPDFSGNAVAADLNQNGWKDVLIADTNFDIPGCQRRALIFRNLGDGPSVTLSEEVAGSGASAVVGCIPVSDLRGTFALAVFDIDGDGWPDLVVGQCTGTRVFMNVTGRRGDCPADLNRDGVVDAADLGILLGSFGAGVCGDANGDGTTDAQDLGLLLSSFGRVCG